MKEAATAVAAREVATAVARVEEAMAVAETAAVAKAVTAFGRTVPGQNDLRSRAALSSCAASGRSLVPYSYASWRHPHFTSSGKPGGSGPYWAEQSARRATNIVELYLPH